MIVPTRLFVCVSGSCAIVHVALHGHSSGYGRACNSRSLVGFACGWRTKYRDRFARKWRISQWIRCLTYMSHSRRHSESYLWSNQIGTSPRNRYVQSAPSSVSTTTWRRLRMRQRSNGHHQPQSVDYHRNLGGRNRRRCWRGSAHALGVVPFVSSGHFINALAHTLESPGCRRTEQDFERSAVERMRTEQNTPDSLDSPGCEEINATLEYGHGFSVCIAWSRECSNLMCGKHFDSPRMDGDLC